MQPKYSLLLVSSPTQQRSVYFKSKEAMDMWYNEILANQGFSERPIDQYEAQGNLGDGTFGTVILAQHVFSKLKVAIKFMSKEKIENFFTTRNQAFSELELLKETSSAQCPNILELLETFEDSQYFFVVTKFMPAGDLLNYLIKQSIQPLPEVQARLIIKQVAQGIKALHERFIVHRDIKVENVLMNNFTMDAQAVISDLGCSIKLSSPMETLTFKIGTPGYLAPEIIEGRPYGMAVDIWSLGCLLHVLVTASPPFWEDDRSKRNHRVRNE